MNSCIEEVIRSLQDCKLQTSRHGLFNLVIKFINRRIDLSSISSGRLIDHECHTGFLIHARGEAIVQRA